MHPCDFLIVAITCALLFLRLLAVCSFWLSTQVQIFFLPIYGGAVKITSEALPQMVPMICRPEDPTLEYLYPLLFFPPSLLCSFSAFCHCSCQPALLRSLKAIKWVFKQKTLACFCTPSKWIFLALEAVQRLGSCLIVYSQTHSQMSNSEGWANPSITTNIRHMVDRGKRAEWQPIKKKTKQKNPRKQQSPLHYTWAGLESKRSQDSGAAVPRRLLAPIFLMREPSRLDIVGSGSSFQPMLFSPQRNEPSYSLIPFWHPWPKCLQSHRPTATAIHFLSTTYPFAFC